MQELIRQVLHAARGMWSYRWPALIVAWVVAAAGVIGLFKIPDQYEAQARIYVDTQSILKPLMQGLTVAPNVQLQVTMLSRTLLSRPNLEKLVRMADLDLEVKTPVEREKLFQALAKDIQFSSVARNNNLYQVRYVSPDREKAKRVVQSLVSIFVESGLGASRRDNTSALAFLNEQIKERETRLAEAEAAVKAFRLRNFDMQSPDGRDASARLSEAARELSQARLALKEAENARNAVREKLAEAERGAVSAATGAPAASPDKPVIPPAMLATPELDARIQAQKRSLDALLQRFTEEHPDVIITRRLIRDLEEQKAGEVAELRRKAEAALAQAAATGKPIGLASSLGNSLAQDLQRMLTTSEAQVASLKARVGELTARADAARAALRTAPEVEAEASKLERIQSDARRSYDEMVARRQKAEMSGELETASGLTEFRLIDPPRVTPQPVAPNRLLLLPLPLLLGLVVGVVVAFVACQLRPVFNDAEQLRRRFDLPMLGVVSLVMNDTDRIRERKGVLGFAGASGGLVGLFALGMIAMALMAQRGG